MSDPHTVRDLINTLAQCNQDAIVTLGYAPGPLGHITETVNGYVILDRVDDETLARLRAAGKVIP